MQIHAIQTGAVRIRASQLEGRGRLTRRLRPMVDAQWTAPVPIFCWLIEHPAGLILVDAGETPRVAEPGYLPAWHPYYRRAVDMQVGPDDGVGARMRALGFDPADLRLVVFTHLHTDHAGGMGDVALPGVGLLTGARELRAARGPFARVEGYLPHRWPADAQLRGIDFPDGPVGTFAASRRLTEDGAVAAIPTPGHTPGHLSVVVRDGDRTVVLAGDASYTEGAMRAGKVDGVAPNARKARGTLARFAAWAQREPLVYLPSHDPEALVRLETISSPARTPAGS